MAGMTRSTPDPTFHPSPHDAADAPLAYVAAFDRAAERPDAMVVP
jgi:selenium-binding protein 1